MHNPDGKNVIFCLKSFTKFLIAANIKTTYIYKQSRINDEDEVQS